VANHCYIIVADYGPRISGNEQKEIMGSQLARAWIETFKKLLCLLLQLVKSQLARAWIETAKLKCPRITEATESNWLLDIEIWSHPKQ
jgi:hypothetical protein